MSQATCRAYLTMVAQVQNKYHMRREHKCTFQPNSQIWASLHVQSRNCMEQLKLQGMTSFNTGTEAPTCFCDKKTRWWPSARLQKTNMYSQVSKSLKKSSNSEAETWHCSRYADARSQACSFWADYCRGSLQQTCGQIRARRTVCMYEVHVRNHFWTTNLTTNTHVSTHAPSLSCALMRSSTIASFLGQSVQTWRCLKNTHGRNACSRSLHYAFSIFLRQESFWCGNIHLNKNGVHITWDPLRLLCRQINGGLLMAWIPQLYSWESRAQQPTIGSETETLEDQHTDRQTHRQTDGQTDRQTSRQIER